MPIPYIWFGKNDVVDNAGKLESSSLNTNADNWTVVALLGWDQNTPNTFTPALLVRDEGKNPVLNKLLELLGAKPDTAPEIPSDWRVLRFDDISLTPEGGVTVDIATPLDSHHFLKHKTPLTAKLVSKGLSIVDFVNAEKVETTVLTDTASTSSSVEIAITVKDIDLTKIGFKAPFLIDETITLSYSTADEKLRINGELLNSDPADGATPLGDSFSLAIDGTKVGLDVPVPNGTYTYQPLVKGIPGSKIDFDWKSFRIRLHENELGLAAVPGDIDDVLGTATFTLPLIQAAIGEGTANALAKLVPTKAAALTPLAFKVTIKRPADTIDVSPLVYWTAKLSEKVGAFAENVVSTLIGVFESDDSGDTNGNIELSSFFAPLQELAGKAGDVLCFRLSQVKSLASDSEQTEFINAIKKLDKFNTVDYSLPLALKIGKDPDKPDLVFLVVLRINLWEGRLKSNRAYFYLASGTDGRQMLDLKAFAMTLPARSIAELKSIFSRTEGNSLKGLPDEVQHDGYLDFESLDVVLDAQPASQANRPQLAVFFPGGLKKEDGSVDSTQEEKRVRILLEDFDPEVWPEKPKEKSKTLQLRLGARGLTFSAKADTVKDAKITVTTGLPTVPMRLVETRDGLNSGLVVIDNQVRYANLAGRISVPGFDNFEANVALGLRRDKPNEPPVVTAVIDIDRTDSKPLARMKMPLLKAQLDDLRMQLTWKSDKNDWDFRAWATGAFSITSDVGSTGGIEGLDQPRAIPFRDLDLTRLHKGDGQIPLGRPVKPEPDTANTGNGGPSNSTPSTVDQVARFELLEKQFRVEFYNSILHWDLEKKTASFEVERARFEYQASSGDLDVAIEAGKIKLHFNGNNQSLKFETPSSFGLQVRIGTQLSFAGNVGWEDTPTENYFRADGRLQMTGFPEVAGSLKLGTGIKDDGKIAPNVAIFAELPYEADLFSGVVLKRVGLGLGLNNRLAGIGDRPDPRAILANLDRIDPKQSRNWSFVSEAGVYVSVVATAMIASNRGKDDVVCAYVAKLLLSIDTNIDIVAAAQVWLFSSPGYITQQDHERRPTLIGAAVLSARERTFTLVAQTTPRPAIESNQMLSDLLSRVQARFSFYLSSDLADFYLEELSYRDQLFGINVVVIGSYRIAIGRFGALMRAMLSLRGELPEKKLLGGIGGFSFRGNFGLDADFGGLVSSRGLAAYGSIRVGISFRVSAFVFIPTVAFETIEYDTTFSITISIPYLHCKRWKCKWRTREITETVTVRIKLVYPVFSIEEYHLPESSLDLVLEGILAFDESGGIGFSGRLAISTSVCGHELRIAPQFDYRPEVATNVRRRIAAVEDHINQLRGLPRAPVQNLPANEAKELPPVETWYYYKSISGDKEYHLLVPSPEYPQWWYTPRATDMSQYANLPRDTSVAAGSVGAASNMEKLHLSPLRDAVMRMVLPFKSSDGSIKQIVDLAMPWDRGNYDSLPGERDDQELTELVMKLTQIESAFLNTAAKAMSADNERFDWLNQEDRGVPLTDVEIVSDPRPESSARVYWTLTDQMTRPDGVYPYRYRPVEELVSEGFSGVSRRGDIGRLLRFEQVSQRAAVQGRYDDAAPSAARRLRNSRATLLSTILADLTRKGGLKRYEPIDAIQLERPDEDTNKNIVVTRRRAPIYVFPKTNATPINGEFQYEVGLTYSILDNSTELNLEPDPGDTHIDLKVQWNGDQEVEVKIEYSNNSEKNYVNLDPTNPAALETRHKPLIAKVVTGAPNTKINVRITRGAAVASVVFELQGNATKPMRKVGLFAVTKVGDKLELDLDQTRIIRNEPESMEDATEPVTWSYEKQIRIIPMNDGGGVSDPIEAVQRWVRCLPPCQEFLSSDQNVETNEVSRVRVRLPVKFDEQLLKAELPRLNGFEIYRRFPWDTQPVKIAEGVPPILRTVDDGNRKVLLVESFLYGEDFVFNRETGRFTGSAAAVIPGVTPIEYSLRAVPFGHATPNDRPTFRRWPTVTLHVPPLQRQLPALGIVIPVDSLFLLKDQNGAIPDSTIPIHLVDSSHTTWDWPEECWEELEIWAEPQRIRSSGSYAIEGEPQEIDPQAAARQNVRKPGDLTVERIPESVSGKILVARLRRPMPETWMITAGTVELKDGLKALQPGFGYRLFIRPSVQTQAPLVQPLALYLIRQLPLRMDEATPVLHVDRLELIEQSEVSRVMMPIGKLSGEPAKDAWVPGADFRIVRRTEDNDEFEHLRITWDHLSDLDAGVEILLQDVDEPHRVDRQLVTAQEEAIFQMAIQDFRNPALWRTFPNRKTFKADWESLEDFKNKTQETGEQHLTSMVLWAHENNPALARVGKTRTELTQNLAPYAQVPTEKNDWGMLHRSLAGYIAAMLAYQRTPLAPATSEDREGLELLINLSQALVLGLKVPDNPLPGAADLADVKALKFTELRMALDKQEQKLRERLRLIESIDLSQMKVTDSPAAYAELKLQLHDIDIAKQLAGIAARRLAAADDLLNLPAADEIPIGDAERLPLFDTWQRLVARYKKHFRIGIDNITLGAFTVVTTTEDHGLVDGERVELIGFAAIENREFSVTVNSGRQITIAGWDTVGATLPTVGIYIERVASQHARPLVRLFEDVLPNDHATGQQAAIALKTFLELIRDPSVLLKSATANGYRKDVAKLVPLVSGMAAALDALQADAQANDWTLVRRPHHQLAVEDTKEGRIPVEEPLRLYLPDTIGGPNPQADRSDPSNDQVNELQDADLVVPFVNLLERMGCAVDLAVVDAFNQPLPQARLLDWIGSQPWTAILRTLTTIADSTPITHEVVLITGREPDTDRDHEDRSLGYAFVKLAVVPRTLLGDCLKGRDVFKTWLKEYRSLHYAGASGTPSKGAELEATRKMAEAWWNSIARLPGMPEGEGVQRVGHCIVETRGRRWATVPVLGGRAHIDWKAFDAAGRLLQVALRRVSRYEGLLRWARGTVVPMLPRIHGLTARESQTVSLRRRMVANEEPKTLPVLISPHPTRIEFIYALPTSGARATVSGLSTRRTGYQGIAAQFSHSRINGPLEPTVKELIGGINQFESLIEIQVTDATSVPNQWKVTSVHLKDVTTVVLFDENRENVLLCSFVPTNNDPTSGLLKFTDGDIGNFKIPTTGIVGLTDPLNKSVANHSVSGTFKRIGSIGSTRFRLTPDDQSVALNEDPKSYIGHLLLTVGSGGLPTHARLVRAFSVADQTIELDMPLPNNAYQVRLLAGAAPPRRSPIVRSEAGVPNLFRHERLISLPDLPYYRKYEAHVGPQFDATISSVSDKATADFVFAERKPSILSVHQPALISQRTSTSITYAFRLLLTRQGDLLTPAELEVDRELDELEMAESDNDLPLLLNRKLSAADLPDLNCTYQILWELPSSSAAAPIYAELVEVLLPGSPQWVKPGGGSADAPKKPVMIQNRNGAATQYVPIQLWWPSKIARPVYVVEFEVMVSDSDTVLGDIFMEPDGAWLQLQRDGYRSRPVKILSKPKSE